MKSAEIKKVIEGKVTEAVRREIDKIDQTVTNLVSNCVCSLLGIEKNGSIDHCNGREPILAQMIKGKAQEQVERLVSNFKFNSDDKFVNDAFKKEFKEQLDRRIKWHAEELSKEIAGKVIKKYTDKELIKIGFEADETIKAVPRY